MRIENYISDLSEIVNIDSGCDCPVGQRQIADFFEKKFKAIGWTTRRYGFGADKGDTLVCMNREAEHYDVMLIGHIDTVFNKGTVIERPFEVDGARAYGAGTYDMKQGCVLMYHLLSELPLNISERLNILAVFNHDEEIGSPCSVKVTSEYAKITDAVLVFEGAGLDGARCIRRKGRVSLRARFIGKDGHCGFVFENGARSAISEMARWIVALDSLQSEERGTSVNIGVVSGGTAENIVAAEAELTADIRFSEASEYHRIEKTVVQLLGCAKERGIEVDIENRMYTPALTPTEDTLVFVDRLSRMVSARGEELILRARGGLSDANKLAPYCRICIDGMGPAGDNDHTAEEFLEISSVQQAYTLAFDALTILANDKTEG